MAGCFWAFGLDLKACRWPVVGCRWPSLGLVEDLGNPIGFSNLLVETSDVKPKQPAFEPQAACRWPVASLSLKTWKIWLDFLIRWLRLVRLVISQAKVAAFEPWPRPWRPVVGCRWPSLGLVEGLENPIEFSNLLDETCDLERERPLLGLGHDNGPLSSCPSLPRWVFRRCMKLVEIGRLHDSIDLQLLHLSTQSLSHAFKELLCLIY